MIIVEGMDNTGKTTLIQQLAEDLKLTIAKTYYKPWGDRDEMVLYANWLEICPFPLIVDRHPFISELIYGTTLRGHSHSDRSLAASVQGIHLVIYCRPPTDTILSTLQDREQMEGVDKHAKALLDLYDEVVQDSVHYDYTAPEAYSNLLKEIKRGRRVRHH